MSDDSSTRRSSSRRSPRVFNVDLSLTPAESSTLRANHRSSQPPPAPPPTMAAGGRGIAGAPIDLEASDDEIQLLSSPRGFPQARNQSRRRNRPVIVVVDDERGIRTGPPGFSVEYTATVSSRNSHSKRQRFPPNRTVINCESYSTAEDNPNNKKKKVSKPSPKKPVPKEPTFSCPICMAKLVSPCSTVCGHIFCEGCIKAAIQVKKQCPTCRTKLTMKNNFHKVFLPTTDD